MLKELLELFKGLIGKVSKTKPGTTQSKELIEIGDELKKLIETTAAGTTKIDSQIDGLKKIEKQIADAEARNVVAKSDLEKLEDAVVKDMEDSFRQQRPQKTIDELKEEIAKDKVVDIQTGKPVGESLDNITSDLETILENRKKRNKTLNDALDELLGDDVDDFVGNEFDNIYDKMEDMSKKDPLLTKIPAKITRHPTVKEISKRTGKSEDEVEEIIIDYLNEGYEAGSPKRMQYGDQEALKNFLDVTDRRPGGTSGLMSEIEEFDITRDIKATEDLSGFTTKEADTAADEAAEIAAKEDRTTAYETETIKALAANKLKIQELRAAGKNAEADALLKVTEDAVDAIRSGDVGPNELLDIFPFDPSRKKQAKGGRIGYAEGDPEGVDNKKGVSRRSFLKGAGALGILAMIPGIMKKAVVGKTAATAAKTIPIVDGMPMWFPALVNKIRTSGKKVREPDYKDFTSGGDTEIKYVLEDKSLPEGRIVMYEDQATGAISISGRGDEFQQASLDYYPGENKVMTNQLGQREVVTGKPTFDASAQTQAAARAEQRGGFLGNKDTTDELMGQQSVNVNEKGTFEAGEFAKGEFRDIENYGGIDDMRGGLTSWAKLVTGSDDQLKKVAEEFKKLQKDPNILDDMAKGGRVGYGNGGGVGTLFKRRV